jgi:hypothetical protein
MDSLAPSLWCLSSKRASQLRHNRHCSFPLASASHVYCSFPNCPYSSTTQSSSIRDIDTAHCDPQFIERYLLAPVLSGIRHGLARCKWLPCHGSCVADLCYQSPVTCDHPRAVHGHPSPKMPEPTSVQAILDLFRKSDIEFQLRGLLGVDRSTVSDVYSPEVRRSPTTHRMTVTHLDLVTCWKGLSYAQAAEILFWENVFRLSLERMVWDVVTRLFAKQAREDNG